MPPFASVLTFVADGASIDVMTGRVSAFNLLEEVAALKAPAFLARLAVVNVYTLAAAETYDAFHDRVRILSPSGETLISSNTTRIAPVRPHYSSVHIFAPLIVPALGPHRIVAEWSPDSTTWEQCSEHRLLISEGPPYPVLKQPQ